jgi:IclR family KDG regulon transcriptional repressor
MNPLHKIFSVIESVVARQDTGMTYSEVVSALKIPKSSAHRILKDLTELGYLNFNPETKRYFGSLRLASLGAEVMSHFRLREHIRPYLMEMHRGTEHTINLGIMEGTTGVFVDKIESRDFGIKLFSEIGKTFPLHCTGLGKALLAFSPEKDVSRFLETRLEAVTERTITDPVVFRRELSLIRQRRYAIDNEEITRGIMCVAAPVFGFREEVICAISLTFPSYINEDRGIDQEISVVKKYAELISGTLGRQKTEGAGNAS